MKLFLKYILLLVFINCYVFNIAFSQKATATIDSTKILIGDQMHLKLQYSFPKNCILYWPQFGDTLSKSIEVVKISGLDTVKTSDGNSLCFSQIVTLTSFDSGQFVVPPIQFAYSKKGDTTKIVSTTNPIIIYVNNVAVDTTKAIKDIKAPIKAPLTFLEILPWLLGILLIVGIVILVLYIIKKKKKKQPILSILKPTIPPHIKALEQIEKLRESKLWQQGKIKEFHSSLSDIVRIYIEEQFNVLALEMITYEIVGNLQNLLVNKEPISKLEKTLKMADLVKFAKFNPLPDENDMSLKNAIAFIKETAPKIEEKKEKTEKEDDIIVKEIIKNKLEE